jgi:hypothetical protein
MNDLIKKILIEWSFRLDDGMINLHNPKHMIILSEVLKDMELPTKVILEVMSNMTESEASEKAKKMGLVHLGRGSYGKEKGGQATHQTKDGKLIKVGDKQTKTSPNVFSQPQKPVETETTENEKSQQTHIDKGFVTGAAPGNPGSMYNEIMSGKVADLIRENPDLSDEELTKLIIEKYGNTGLGKQQNSKTRAGGLKKGDLPNIEGVSNGLLSKTLIAVKSGRRKAERAKEAEKDLGWENTKSEEFFGDKKGLEEQRKRVRNAKKIVNLDGEEISQEEMLEIIDSSGSGDNPSDTATIITSDDGTITILFTSDKDSLDAIISQSSAKAESTQTDDAILSLVDSGQLPQEEAEAVAGERRNFADKKEKTERKLKEVTNEPAKFLKENISDEMIEKAKTEDNTKKHFESRITKRFKPGGKISSTVLFDDEGKQIKGGQKHDPEDYLKQVGWKEGTEPTEKQQVEAFLLYSRTAENPEADTQKLVSRMNKQNDGPDVSEAVENIRKEVIKDEQEHIDFLNEREIEVGGKKVKLGNVIEGNNIWKQGHMDAIGGKKGVHKHRGMFEVNNAGQTINNETLKKVLKVDNKNQFLQRFEVVEATEQKGVSGAQKGRVTGSTRIVYAVMVDKDNKETRVPIMEKRQRSKDGELGKLQTVYKWTKEFQQLVKDNQ